MKWDKVEILLRKYYEGQTSLEEEKELREFFCTQQDLPDHLRQHAAAFKFYAEKQDEEPEWNLDEEQLLGKLEQQASTRHLTPLRLFEVWKVAAGIALIMGAFWAGSHFKQQLGPGQQAEIAELRREVQQMREMLQESPSASERISVVNRDFIIDDEIVEVLAHTMNTDSSVNVRLAACHALFRIGDHPSIRKIFVRSLAHQDDPLMQISLIEMLVELNEKAAIGEFENLLQQKDLLPIVKYKATEGLGILI